jgi:hypothetical protein
MVQTGTVAMTRGPKGEAATVMQQPNDLRGVSAA